MKSMLGQRLLLLAVGLAVCASNAEAQPVHVTLEWPSGIPAYEHPSAHIRAVQTAGPDHGSAPLEAETESDSTTLNFSDGIWQVQASAPGYWSQAAEAVVDRQAHDSLRLVFWPAASLHGVIVTSGGETLPDSIEVQLSANPASRIGRSTSSTPVVNPVQGPSHAELNCRINAGTWNCLAPTGLFDIRLGVAGYVPRYEWGVSLKRAESVDFGKAELLRTASLFGRVVQKDNSNPAGPCRATLRPDMERRGPSNPDQETESASDANASYSVALNQRGYFQVVGVVPGRYALAVACQCGSAFQNLRVQANTETRIDPPLRLEDRTLEITAIPKTDPAGQPWKLAVYETGPHYLLIADGATTSADGRWVRHGLMAGKYHVIVRGSDGTAWLQKYFDLDNSSGPLSLRMGSVSVAGRVTMSSQPVHARLVFTNNSGGQSATLISTENGRFQGVLPVGSANQASSWTVQAHVAQPPLTQQLLGVIVRPHGSGAAIWLDLDLPAIPVRGTVVSPDGKPESNVEVVLEKARGPRVTTSTDDAGRFEMSNLPLGKYTAMADSFNGTSDRTPFEVGEGSSSEIKLVLNPYRRYSFNVASDMGPVSDAAVQVWIAPGVPRAFERTDENGRFDVRLPPGTKEVGLTIGAPGFPIRLARLPVSSDPGDDPPETPTITLDTTAGTLVLHFEPPGHVPDSSVALYLVHNGAVQDARTIANWGTDQAGTNVDGPVTIDAVEPGDYALCRVNPAQISVLWTGALPSDRCRKGSLHEGETLSLSPQ